MATNSPHDEPPAWDCPHRCGPLRHTGDGRELWSGCPVCGYRRIVRDLGAGPDGAPNLVILNEYHAPVTTVVTEPAQTPETQDDPNGT